MLGRIQDFGSCFLRSNLAVLEIWETNRAPELGSEEQNIIAVQSIHASQITSDSI
jgi:hypothetical protein